MILELIEPYLVGGVTGFIFGIIVAWIYFRSKIEMKSIGQVIEYSMIHKDIKRLGTMARQLEKLVADVEGCSEDITIRLDLVTDIEQNVITKEEEQEPT